MRRIFLTLGAMLLAACGAVQTAPTRTPTSVTTKESTPQIISTPKVLKLALVTPNPAQNPVEADDKEDPTNPSNMTQAQLDKVFDALPKVGSHAPDFSLPTLDGMTVTLSALRGHPVVINFWASWCVACRLEAPELEAAYQRFKPNGLVVLGINDAHADKLADAKTYVDQYKMTFPVLLDVEGKVDTAYRIPGLPTSFFVDKDGVIRQVVMGQMTQRDVRESLELIKAW